MMDISEIIEENQHMLHASLEEKKISFKSEIPDGTIAYADKNMVNTIIRNLLINAIKFTSAGGNINISHKILDKYIAISVSDTGIGMEKEVMDKLFNFDQFYSSVGTGGESGTGLGLIVCYDFIKKHLSEISVKSKPGKGTTFTFTLPVKEI